MLGGRSADITATLGKQQSINSNQAKNTTFPCYSVLAQCWASVADDIPTVNQHSVNSCQRSSNTPDRHNLYRMFFSRFLSQFSTDFDEILQDYFRVTRRLP